MRAFEYRVVAATKVVSKVARMFGWGWALKSLRS